MSNLAHDDYEQKRFEILDGKIYMMATPLVGHNLVVLNISRIFSNYLKGKKCLVLPDQTTVFLSKRDEVIPDVSVVCDPDILRRRGIYGAPDLVVEVLSASTTRNDRGYKKKLYETHGVKEYWIVEPASKKIEVYLLVEGKYELDNVYVIYRDFELEDLEERGFDMSQIQMEFSPSIFPDLAVSVEEVFEKVGDLA